MFQSDFDYAFKTIVGFEGKDSDHPDDRGGRTRYGISKRAYPYIDMDALTLGDAKQIYKRDYWNICGAKEMTTRDLKVLLFDIAVNHGAGRARIMLQEALNLLNNNGKLYDDLEIDGIIGRKTKAAIKANEPHYIIMALITKRLALMDRIADGTSQEAFAKGWMNRYFSFISNKGTA